MYNPAVKVPIMSFYKRPRSSSLPHFLSDLARTMLLPLLLSLLLVASSAEDARKPRLFYVSTTSTTSTHKTETICFASSSAAPVACGKRKRAIETSVPESALAR